MKKVFNVITGIFSAIILLLSVVFIVIEGRLLFCGDWVIYDNAAAGFFKYFFRLVLALFAATHSIFEYINMKKKNDKITHYLFIGNFVLVIMGMVLVFTATNMVGEIGLLIAMVTLLVKVLGMILTLKIKPSKDEEKQK